ncbi:MAG: hypothetical protein AABX65_01365, partial [Nanoarchaeota archaeon]
LSKFAASCGVLNPNFEIKKRGDILILSQELKVTQSVLKHAIAEEKILTLFPGIHKSKANALARLKTDRDKARFMELNSINKLSARQLYKSVKNWNLELEKTPLLLVNQEEHDIILGSLMGDASIRQIDRNSCFRFSHSLKQRAYAEWKMNKLTIFPISEFTERTRKIRNRFIHALDYSTKTHSVFNYYRKLFYNTGKKRITTDILDQLNAKSLAIWICDDRSYSSKQEYIIICTNAYSLEEHELMKEFLNGRFGLNPTIGFRDGKYYYLRFRQKDTKELIKIIRPFIPNSMLYKIGGKNVK